MWEAWRTFTVRLPAPTEREYRYPGDTIGATTSMLNTQTRFERLAFSGYGARGSQSLVGGRGNRAGHCGGAGAAYLTQECEMDVAMPPWGRRGPLPAPTAT